MEKVRSKNQDVQSRDSSDHEECRHIPGGCAGIVACIQQLRLSECSV